jgi:hypothetical protein
LRLRDSGIQRRRIVPVPGSRPIVLSLVAIGATESRASRTDFSYKALKRSHEREMWMLILALPMTHAFDRNKFKSLLHYVVWKAGDRDGFGATKLYKVLWFSDARAFMLKRKPITGETYIREKYGPLPKHAMDVITELERDGAIELRNTRYFNKALRQFHSLRTPDRLALEDGEREIVDYWIQHIAYDHTAASISEESHDLAWEIARMGEEIPYFAIFATRIRDPDEKEIAWARQRAKELGLP